MRILLLWRGGESLFEYLIQDGDQLIILLGGGTKKNQKADIDQAKTFAQEYKQRKKSGDFLGET